MDGSWRGRCYLLVSSMRFLVLLLFSEHRVCVFSGCVLHPYMNDESSWQHVSFPVSMPKIWDLRKSLKTKLIHIITLLRKIFISSSTHPEMFPSKSFHFFFSWTPPKSFDHLKDHNYFVGVNQFKLCDVHTVMGYNKLFVVKLWHIYIYIYYF